MEDEEDDIYGDLAGPASISAAGIEFVQSSIHSFYFIFKICVHTAKAHHLQLCMHEGANSGKCVWEGGGVGGRG